jgi:hypothetical protein
MATMDQIVEQCHEIVALVKNLQALFLGPQLLTFFKTNPDKVQTILAQTEGQRTRRLVLLGMKAALNSQILPPDKDLHTPQGWLNVDDVILPWRSGWVDRPRVIAEETENGYRWRYLGEDESIMRDPNRFWPWLNNIGLEYVELTGESVEEQIDEIYEIQSTEIETLKAQLEYFGSKKFLDE